MPQVAATRARKPRNQYHHGDLRRALLQEAVRTIADEGVEHLTLREAGTRLGVSRTALYRHFADKAALLAAVASEGFHRFRDDLVHAWAQAPGTRQGFERMGEAYVRFAVEHSGHYRVMFGDFRHLCAKDPDHAAVAGSAFRVLVDALTSLQQAGLVRAADAMTQAGFVWSLVHGASMLAINGQLGPDPVTSGALPRLLRVSFDALWDGIGAEQGAGR